MEPLQPDDPDRAGPYRLLARLGAGGMGVVYLGRSRGGRAVAVKVIRKGFTGDSRYRARFRREVDAARTVTGVFTAPVLDADPDADAPWLATAYLPGLSLREAVGEFGPLPPGAVRGLAAGLAEALAAIHAAGVVHRDLKPGNVMLTAGGPRVIDFGIARPADAAAVTRAGLPVGTPGFMAPEQVRGEEVGPAADVFSLGTLLAYAASGTEPFGTGPAKSRHHRVMTGQADLGAIGEPWLRELVADCLRPEPGERPSAAGVLERLGAPGEGAPPLQGTAWLPVDVAEEIDRRTGGSVPERPLAPRPVPRGVGRRTLIAGGAAGLVTLGTAGLMVRERYKADGTHTAGAVRPQGHGAPRSPEGPPPQPVPRWKKRVSTYYTDLEIAGGVLLAKEAEDVHAMDPRTGRILWERTAASTSTVAGDVAYLADPDDWHLSAVRAESGKGLWTYRPPFGEYPAPGPVVTASVACFGDERIRALDARDGGLRWTRKVNAERELGAGGGLVAAVAEKKLTGLDARSGRTRWTYDLDEGSALQIGDGLVFVCDSHGTLHAVRAEDGKPAWRRPVNGGRSALGDGVVYVSSYDGDVLALRAATGAPIWSRRLGRGEGASYGQPSTLGLYGGTLYVGCTDRNVYALDAATGRVLWQYGPDMGLRSAPVSAAGLAFIGTRDGYVRALGPPSRNGGADATPRT